MQLIAATSCKYTEKREMKRGAPYIDGLFDGSGQFFGGLIFYDLGSIDSFSCFR